MLTLKLTAGVLSEDGTSIHIQDTTGLYNATTNPGGYGAPNPVSGDSLLALIEYSIFGGKTNLIVTTAADIIAGRTFDAVSLGLTTDTTKPYLLPDGVNVFQYLVGYDVPGAISVEGGTIDTTAVTIPDGVKYVSFSSNNTVAYEIKEITANSIVLYEEDPLYTPGDTLIVFYETESYSLIDTYIQKLIDRRVVNLSQCDGSEVEIFEDVMNLTAAASRFGDKDYLGANTLITTLNRKYEYVNRRVQR